MKRLLAAILIAPIRAYRRWISPAFAPRCRYYPTCSAYAVQSIRELGPLRGSIVAGWRLLRCNPWSHGGVDKLEDRRLFRGTSTRSGRQAASAATKSVAGATPAITGRHTHRGRIPPAGGSGGARLT